MWFWRLAGDFLGYPFPGENLQEQPGWEKNTSVTFHDSEGRGTASVLI